MVRFSVFDYDVLSTNDFGGEAYLPLASVPGLANATSSVDNLHGLKQVQLPLMFEQNKGMYKCLKLS
jgi:BAI1-associated protein 3